MVSKATKGRPQVRHVTAAVAALAAVGAACGGNGVCGVRLVRPSWLGALLGVGWTIALASSCGQNQTADGGGGAGGEAIVITCWADSSDNACACGAGKEPNSFIDHPIQVDSCTPATVAAAASVQGGQCCVQTTGTWPPVNNYGPDCLCDPYYCSTGFYGGETLCSCGFGGLGTNTHDKLVAECKAPTGGHYCWSSPLCFAQKDPCPSTYTELADCSAASISQTPDVCGIDDGFTKIASCGDASPGVIGSTSAQGATTTGSSMMGWADASTCNDGAENIYICCGLGGGSCESVDAYAACCENKSCSSGKLIACLATHSASTVDTCNAALSACH